jgi:hypothetical protein
MVADTRSLLSNQELQEVILRDFIIRDFANGFLFAEILSKYYPLDIQMHSFDTGTGTLAKKNNWSILERFFAVFDFQ